MLSKSHTYARLRFDAKHKSAPAFSISKTTSSESQGNAVEAVKNKSCRLSAYAT